MFSCFRLNSFITRRALEPFRPCFIAKVSRQVNGRVALFNGSVERVIGRITPFSGLDLRILRTLLFSLLNCHPGSVLRTLLPTTWLVFFFFYFYLFFFFKFIARGERISPFERQRDNNCEKYEISIILERIKEEEEDDFIFFLDYTMTVDIRFRGSGSISRADPV